MPEDPIFVAQNRHKWREKRTVIETDIAGHKEGTGTKAQARWCA